MKKKTRIASEATAQITFILLVNSQRPRKFIWFEFLVLQLYLNKLMHSNFFAVLGQNSLQREKNKGEQLWSLESNEKYELIT